MIPAVMNAIYAIAHIEALIYAIALIVFITARIIAYLISHPQINVLNISHITSHLFLRAH